MVAKTRIRGPCNGLVCRYTPRPMLGSLRRFRTAAAVILGGIVGLGAFTFSYADGASYLRDDPAACANCHIMQEHYDAWQKGSHHAVATCNDCHAPHDGFMAKYFSKARNGALHSWAFTTGSFPEPLRIHEYNRRITEAACRSCHESIGQDLAHGGDATSCLRCHASVGHDR